MKLELIQAIAKAPITAKIQSYTKISNLSWAEYESISETLPKGTFTHAYECAAHVIYLSEEV